MAEKDKRTPRPLYQTLGTSPIPLYLTAQVVNRPGEKELCSQPPGAPWGRDPSLSSQLYAAFTRQEERSVCGSVQRGTGLFMPSSRYYEEPVPQLRSFRDCPGNTEAADHSDQGSVPGSHRRHRFAGKRAVCPAPTGEHSAGPGGECALALPVPPGVFHRECRCSAGRETAALMEFMLRRGTEKPYHKAPRTSTKCVRPGCMTACLPDPGSGEGPGQFEAKRIHPQGQGFFQENKKRLAQVSWLGMVLFVPGGLLYHLPSQEEKRPGNPSPRSAWSPMEGPGGRGAFSQDPTRPPGEGRGSLCFPAPAGGTADLGGLYCGAWGHLGFHLRKLLWRCRICPCSRQL